MQELIDLYRHNAWANEHVFALAQGVDPSLLQTEAPGTRDTVKGTLMSRHLQESGQKFVHTIETATPELLARRGVPTPDLDYIVMLDEQDLGSA